MLAFEAVSGLKVNLAKSCIYNVNADSSINELAELMGCNIEEFPTVYLGLPLDAKVRDKRIWQCVLDKCTKKLVPWKKKIPIAWWEAYFN